MDPSAYTIKDREKFKDDMPVAPLKVELLAKTPDALSLIYAAFRQCYHAGFVADMSVGVNVLLKVLPMCVFVRVLMHPP